MDLDDLDRFRQVDPQGYIDQIDRLPDQLESAWTLGAALDLPAWEGIRSVVIAGVGNSAAGADLLAAYASARCPLPVILHRDYGLPVFARGEAVLVIVVSHSGSSEETLSAFNTALDRGCRILTITGGGALAERAQAQHLPVWAYPSGGEARAAIGFSFGLLLAAFTRLGLIPDPAVELQEAAAAMRQQQETIRLESAVMRNPAKRAAGQAVGRAVTVIASDILAPVARRWKAQVSEVAKAWGQSEQLPEADHTMLPGQSFPEALQPHLILYFLRAPSDHPRNLLRSDLTRQSFMMAGWNTDFYNARGSSELAHLWTALHFGDYLAYYLAAAYGTDPVRMEAVEELKQALQD